MLLHHEILLSPLRNVTQDKRISTGEIFQYAKCECKLRRTCDDISRNPSAFSLHLQLFFKLLTDIINYGNLHRFEDHDISNAGLTHYFVVFLLGNLFIVML